MFVVQKQSCILKGNFLGGGRLLLSGLGKLMDVTYAEAQWEVFWAWKTQGRGEHVALPVTVTVRLCLGSARSADLNSARSAPVPGRREVRQGQWDLWKSLEESRIVLERTETGRKETHLRVWNVSNRIQKKGVNPREYSKLE